jgi:hypothetical protein
MPGSVCLSVALIHSTQLLENSLGSAEVSFILQDVFFILEGLLHFTLISQVSLYPTGNDLFDSQYSKKYTHYQGSTSRKIRGIIPFDAQHHVKCAF